MDKESINQRVLKSIDYLLKTNALINKTSLAKDLGVSPSKFSEILNNRMKAGTDMMAALSAKHNVSTDFLLTGAGDIIKRKEELVQGKGLPLIPFEAFAGHSPVQYRDLDVEEYYKVTEFKDADFLIRIQGDSMIPRFHGGDIVACKKLSERLFFQWHRIYVIYTRSQGVMIKRVEQSIRKNHIKLVSDNLAYAPFEIPESDISDIALVLGAITME